MHQISKVFGAVAVVGLMLGMVGSPQAQAQTSRLQAYAMTCYGQTRAIGNVTIITSAGRRYFHVPQTCGYLDGLGGVADHPTFWPAILPSDGAIESVTIEGFVQYQTTGTLTPFTLQVASGSLAHDVYGKPQPGVSAVNQPLVQVHFLISIAQP